MPPLRERKEDIPLLVEHFLVEVPPRAGRHPDLDHRGGAPAPDRATTGPATCASSRTPSSAPSSCRAATRSRSSTSPFDDRREAADRARMAGRRSRLEDEADAADEMSSADAEHAATNGGASERRLVQGPGRGARAAAHQGGARPRRRQPHEGRRGARDLSAPALRQDQGVRAGRVSEPTTRTATFTATAEARPRGGIAIRIPVDPAEIWGERDRYYVTGTIERYPMRGVVASRDGEPYLELGPAWCRDPRVGPGASLRVNLSPEGPQIWTLASDFAAALTAEPKHAASSSRWPRSIGTPGSSGSKGRSARSPAPRGSPKSVAALAAGRRER